MTCPSVRLSRDDDDDGKKDEEEKSQWGNDVVACGECLILFFIALRPLYDRTNERRPTCSCEAQVSRPALFLINRMNDSSRKLITIIQADRQSPRPEIRSVLQFRFAQFFPTPTHPPGFDVCHTHVFKLSQVTTMTKSTHPPTDSEWEMVEKLLHSTPLTFFYFIFASKWGESGVVGQLHA